MNWKDVDDYEYGYAMAEVQIAQFNCPTLNKHLVTLNMDCPTQHIYHTITLLELHLNHRTQQDK